jgi:hypothetical protein
MVSCLGVYLNEDIIKYAKLSVDNNKSFKLEEYGVRYVKTNKKETLSSIIQETNSKDIPVIINPQEDIYLNIQLYNQIQNKSFMADVAKMEFEAWCEKNTKTLENYTYVYKISELKGLDNKHNGVLNIIKKKNIEEFSTVDDKKISGMYPTRLLINRLVPQDELNYVLVNFSDELSIETIINGKSTDIRTYLVGMKKILREAKEKKGSFAKSYEACKQLNVFSESESSNNDKEIETVVEPILQEILREVLIIVNKNRKSISKVIITGEGVVFTNIDILFREYLDVKCEILRPNFITNTSNVRNMAEVLETIEAIALAYEALDPISKQLDYIKTSGKIKKSFANFFTSKPKEKKNVKTNIIKEPVDLSKVFTVLVCASIVTVTLLITYILFSVLYFSNVNRMIAKTDTKTKELKSKTEEVNSDAKYVSANAEKYKTINTQVEEVVKQIESNQIGKFTTYNVATFLQSIIKIIPKNVQLNTISSDDNKNIKIVAQSSSYSDLGYFVAQLKLENTLNNVKINNIKNGENTVIEIGGELP